DAAGGHLRPDRPRLVGSVDAVERVAQVHGARAERIFRAARHVARQVGTALEHLIRRPPIRPLALGGDVLDARPGEAGTPDADAVAQRPAVLLDQAEEAIRRIDDGGSGLLAAVVVDHLATIDRVELARLALIRGRVGGLLILRLRRIGVPRARLAQPVAEQGLDEPAAQIAARG